MFSPQALADCNGHFITVLLPFNRCYNELINYENQPLFQLLGEGAEGISD